MPKDRITQLHQGYGFVEFLGEEDADYAIKVMNMIKMYGKPIRVNKVIPRSILIVCHQISAFKNLLKTGFVVGTSCNP